MKSHELAQLLLSMPDIEVGTIHYDSEFDYKYLHLISGVDIDRVRVNGEKVLVLSETYDMIDEQFNPNDHFDLLEIEFLLEDKEMFWRVNEDVLTNQLYALFQGKAKYNQYHLPEDTLVKLTLGYCNETWKPITVTMSMEDAKQYILQNFKVEVEDDEWYWLEAKSDGSL